MFGNILSGTLLAISIGAIFVAATPAALFSATYIAGFSVISWGLDRRH